MARSTSHNSATWSTPFLDAGFNYFDTAWAYPGSEEATRKALVERYPRDAFLLATKAAPWFKCNNAQEAYAQLETSLERTGAGYIDYYLMHNLGSVRTEAFDRFDMWEFARRKREEGVIRHLGLSIHDSADALDTVLSEHPEVEFVQLQVNYLDWDNPVHQSHACLEVARKHGKPIVVMEPLRGGLLANPPESVRHVFEQADPTSSCASWALRFAASQPDVAVVLSGMSDLAQMEANIRTMQDFECMGVEEEAVIARAQDEFAKFDLIPCTGCDYCAKACRPTSASRAHCLRSMRTRCSVATRTSGSSVASARTSASRASACNAVPARRCARSKSPSLPTSNARSSCLACKWQGAFACLIGTRCC